MLYWGLNGLPGYSGIVFDTRTDTWSTLAAGGPSVDTNGGYGAVWTGTEMVLWHANLNVDAAYWGGRYTLATNTWGPHPSWSGPLGAYADKAFWTGSKAIFWGTNAAAPGGAYDPLTDTWSPVSYTNVPPRVGGISDGGPTYWDGAKALVWRGVATYSRRYDLATDTWLAVSGTGEPAVYSFCAGPRIRRAHARGLGSPDTGQPEPWWRTAGATTSRPTPGLR
jgi:hypothetical protein